MLAAKAITNETTVYYESNSTVQQTSHITSNTHSRRPVESCRRCVWAFSCENYTGNLATHVRRSNPQLVHIENTATTCINAASVSERLMRFVSRKATTTKRHFLCTNNICNSNSCDNSIRSTSRLNVVAISLRCRTRLQRSAVANHVGLHRCL